MLTSLQVERAKVITARAHSGQFDKIGEPYIEHPAMVASFVVLLPDFIAADEQTQQDAVAASWLHDVVEDTDETADSLTAGGMSQRTVDTVLALTRTTDVASDDYYLSIRELPSALMVNTADIASNLAPERVAQLDEATSARLATKYDHALGVLGVAKSVIAELHANRQQ